MQTHYQLLEIDRQATSEQIAEAFKRQIDRYDPRRVGDGDLAEIAARRTAELEAAYAVLSDPVQRSAYDAVIDDAALPARPAVRPGVSRRELIMAGAGALAGLAIIAAVWFFSGGSADSAQPAVGETRRAAPQFELPGLDGGTVRLSDYRGKVVLINFWGTWCEPCKEETPALQAVYRDLNTEGLEIIGVNLYSQETDGQRGVRKFLEPYKVAYPIALDTDGEIAREFQISPIPVSYFVDAEGTIRYVKVGTLTEGDVRALFERLRPGTAAGQAQQ